LRFVLYVVIKILSVKFDYKINSNLSFSNSSFTLKNEVYLDFIFNLYILSAVINKTFQRNVRIKNNLKIIQQYEIVLLFIIKYLNKKQRKVKRDRMRLRVNKQQGKGFGNV